MSLADPVPVPAEFVHAVRALARVLVDVAYAEMLPASALAVSRWVVTAADEVLGTVDEPRYTLGADQLDRVRKFYEAGDTTPQQHEAADLPQALVVVRAWWREGTQHGFVEQRTPAAELDAILKAMEFLAGQLPSLVRTLTMLVQPVLANLVLLAEGFSDEKEHGNGVG